MIIKGTIKTKIRNGRGNLAIFAPTAVFLKRIKGRRVCDDDELLLEQPPQPPEPQEALEDISAN